MRTSKTSSVPSRRQRGLIGDIGSVAGIAAAGLFVAPVYIFGLVVMLIIFGALAFNGLSFIWAVIGVVGNFLEAVGPRTLVVLFLAILVINLARKQKRESQMLSLLRTDAGKRYCNLLMRAGVFNALPIAVDNQLNEMCEAAHEEHACERELEDDDAVPPHDGSSTLFQLTLERDQLCSAFEAAGVNPHAFARYILGLADRGKLSMWLR